MKTTCQILMAALLVANLLYGLHQDFYGREAKKPGGFVGAIGTLIVISLLALLYYGAGAFDQIVAMFR